MAVERHTELLTPIGKIYEEAMDSGLNEALFEVLEKELMVLGDYFDVTPSQALFVAVLFSINYQLEKVDINKLIDFFGCNPTTLLYYKSDLDKLHELGIIRKKRRNPVFDDAFQPYYFFVNDKVIEAILNGQSLPRLRNESFNTILDALEQVDQWTQERESDELHPINMVMNTRRMLEANQHLGLFRRLLEMDLSAGDQFLFLHIIWKTLTGSRRIKIVKALENMYHAKGERVKTTQNLLSGEHKLIRGNLLEIEEANFFNEAGIKLSENAMRLLRKEGLSIYSRKVKKENIIEPQEITYRPLYFNPEEQEQIDLLSKLIKPADFTKIKKGLKAKGRSSGLTALLYGDAGTGKTELVLQLGKSTGREIVKIDISRLKSMWFGESEKLVKDIFNDYADYSKHCKFMPILLLNEADALITKRRSTSNSNVIQTENALQNIILEELEHFGGILFAATNLAENLDTAFDRRFLFKVKFKKPVIFVRRKIWESKLPGLSKEKYKKLAENFDFSGGQIDNITRKCDMYEIIHHSAVPFHKLSEFCDKEEMERNHSSKIGFTKQLS
ncbi:MAG: ATP-binding protein [Bacteroidales bacterium]|nr:ATP-binding protein [Bacteroidales bacterium]